MDDCVMPSLDDVAGSTGSQASSASEGAGRHSVQSARARAHAVGLSPIPTGVQVPAGRQEDGQGGLSNRGARRSRFPIVASFIVKYAQEAAGNGCTLPGPHTMPTPEKPPRQLQSASDVAMGPDSEYGSGHSKMLPMWQYTPGPTPPGQGSHAAPGDGIKCPPMQ